MQPDSEAVFRVGAKLRRVCQPAQTPFERVLACGQAHPQQVAKLKQLQSLDPFELGKAIEGKLERI